MGLFDIQDTQDALEDLLIKEREIILSGKFDKIEDLIAEKERLLRALNRTRLNPKTLERLREHSERNAVLYDAVRAGIGSALERIKAMRAPQPNLRTYDRSGRSTEISLPVSKTSKRA